MNNKEVITQLVQLYAQKGELITNIELFQGFINDINQKIYKIKSMDSEEKILPEMEKNKTKKSKKDK